MVFFFFFCFFTIHPFISDLDLWMSLFTLLLECNFNLGSRRLALPLAESNYRFPNNKTKRTNCKSSVNGFFFFFLFFHYPSLHLRSRFMNEFVYFITRVQLSLWSKDNRWSQTIIAARRSQITCCIPESLLARKRSWI